MGYITTIGECFCCETEDVAVRKYKNNKGKTVNLCPYCYSAYYENEHNDVASAVAKMLNVLEVRLKGE